jgi:L-asparaginase
MNKVLIVSAGGIFNKVWNPAQDDLVQPKLSIALKEISSKGTCNFNHICIEDDLNIALIKTTLQEINNIFVIVICNTIDNDVLLELCSDIKKNIVFMDTLVPYSIDPVEATALLCSVYGQLINKTVNGAYIVDSGEIVPVNA